MPILSKSKLIAFRQCPKRLWLEVHRPELRQDSAATEANFQTGHEVGAVARRLYDVDGDAAVLDLDELTLDGLMRATRELLPQRRRIFEAGFTVQTGKRGERVIADILEPAGDGRSWHMVEVKSSTSVKDYHRDDAAIQYHVATSAGVQLASVHVAHIDSSWVYPGQEDYLGLFAEVDLTDEARDRNAEVRQWITAAHAIVDAETPPERGIGAHCEDPFPCGFSAYCQEQHEREHGAVVHPITWLPRIGTNKRVTTHMESTGAVSMQEVPDELLNPAQLRVKKQTLAGRRWFDRHGATQELSQYRLPALFLDFETIAFAVPRWAGTRPYQQVPFQFSLHRVGRTGQTAHSGFLDLSGADPRSRFAQALIGACGTNEPVFVYNRGFEAKRIEELADAFPRWRKPFLAIRDRLVDLLPVATRFYYHPAQEGSWSIKKVLPTIAPELDYAGLDGVQDGGQAQLAYLEAIAPGTSAVRREELQSQLWRYCRLDTFAMVRLWAYFTDRASLVGKTDSTSSTPLGAGA